MEKSQIICLATLSVFALGAVFFVAGVVSPYWATYDDADVNIGLFQICTSGTCTKIELNDQEDWFKAIAGCIVLALLGVLASGASFLWAPVSAGCQCFAGMFTLIAILIFPEHYDSLGLPLDLAWAYVLTTLSAILFLVNGIAMSVLAFQGGCDMTRRPLSCAIGPA